MTRHLPTRGQKFGKCCRRILAHFLSWISSRRSLLGFFSFCHVPPVPGYSVATNHNGPVEIIPLHGRSALEKLLRNVTDVSEIFSHAFETDSVIPLQSWNIYLSFLYTSRTIKIEIYIFFSMNAGLHTTRMPY